MSGHSKWATTKRQKEVVDAKRSSLFTKLSKNIMIAARDGDDPKMNFKLRMAIDQAKEASMPRDNIERAIARATGAGAGQLERILYEGFGPGGSAIIVETVTDNKNRTVSEIKHFFSKNGGNLGSGGSVGWMFDLRGVITLGHKTISDEHELTLIDQGLLDVQNSGENTLLTTTLEQLQAVKETAEKLGLTVTNAEAAYVPKELVPPPNEASVLTFLEGLDAMDDVDKIYTNADV